MSEQTQERTFAVSGMSCHHCKAAVESAIQAVEGVQSVRVDLDQARAVIVGDAEATQIVAAVEDAGYEAKFEIDRRASHDDE